MGRKDDKFANTEAAFKAPSFYDVLENQIRNELRAELEREAEEVRKEFDPNFARAGAFESWMAAHTEKVVFFGKSARDAYGSPRPRTSSKAKQKNEPRVERDLTMEEWIALELLNRYSGQRLNGAFNESELKTAWKRAAFTTHPDRANTESETAAARLFQEIGLAYNLLKAALQSSKAAAA